MRRWPDDVNLTSAKISWGPGGLTPFPFSRDGPVRSRRSLVLSPNNRHVRLFLSHGSAPSVKVEELYQQALESLERGQFRQARELGHQLLKLRFSGAFEVLARSFHGEGNLPVAIQVLENGVQEAPVWPLWLQLGNYRSESGDLVGALEAYRHARACPGAETDQIVFNEALMRLTFGNKEKALELFLEVSKSANDPKLRVVALTHRLTTLVEIDRVTEALLELGEAQLHDQDNAELLSKLAFQLLDRGDHSNALNLARQALGLFRAGSVARVVRLLEGEECDQARLFKVCFQGVFKEEDDLEFSKESRVFAESPEEAEKLAREFEPVDVRSDMVTKLVEELPGDTATRKGVDWSSRLVFANDNNS
jgi:tetratricopeptide (TPR) repeat protein